MRITFLGAGTWGLCLASLLANKGHQVIAWTKNREEAVRLNQQRTHPKLPHHLLPQGLRVTADLAEALNEPELLAESVTSAGIRPVFEAIKKIALPKCPIVLTSKGIEQNSGLLLSEVIVEILGPSIKSQLGCLSGPSLAEEVVRQLPTSAVSAAYDPSVMLFIRDAFATPVFRVYPNADLHGVEFGGAMKNIIAIACGISDGLGFGNNTKAALMTRGLHEMRKLSITKGCKPETLNGLAGLGDLCTSCMSGPGRNHRFGELIASGLTPEEAKKQIGAVVEGAYTCVSALQLGKKAHINVPITEAVYQVIYEGVTPKNAVQMLLARTTKEEHL